ncbi:MAG TPA: class I SAM-dependent methyltransferase [Polyangia bacterium]|jgi:SAM-dependent methyltransferase|nr:class I SAM-dependent methyltransferase [Polyangia bacterium]
MSTLRAQSFGEGWKATPVDRLGVWLSARQIRRHAGGLAGKRVADLGCGFHATFARTILDEAARVVLCDVSLADELKEHPNVTAHEGDLLSAVRGLPTGDLDVALIVSVLEHVWEPLEVMREIRRLLRPGGVCLVNVPSWRGKRFLELSAFRLGLSPPDEMNDHKMYYDVRDLWPLLVKAGFRPQDVDCFSHKLGLNTFAVCRVPA